MSKTTTDQNGGKVSVGTTIKVIVLPDWVETTLPEDEVLVLKSMVGERFVVDEIDKYGCAWVEIVVHDDDEEFACQSLSLEAHEMLVVEAKE